MSETSLKFEIASRGTDFVGLRLEDDTLSCVFPMGYCKDVKKDTPLCEKSNDLRNLISVIYKCETSGVFPLEISDNQNAFPFYDYMEVIIYFINHNCEFYKETESIYDVSDNGKINWSRTIKTTKPSIADGQIVYLDTIRRHSNLKDKDLITNINHYCVYQALTMFGPMFYNLVVEEPDNIYSDDAEKQYWISFLYRKVNQTNNDASKQLFTSMIAILEDTTLRENAKSFSFGTNEFERIWEEMVDKVFGSKEIDKNEFYPSATWRLIQSGNTYEASKLRPDTIFIKDNSIYIIDAKYYRFYLNMDDASLLPSTSDINKQFTYKKYAETKFGKKMTVKQTSFVLPYDKNGNSKLDTRLVATATCKWNEKDDDKLLAYVTDTKSLIEAYINNRQVDFSPFINDNSTI